MRFNKNELASFASNPRTKFDIEGLLIITERQEGIFRQTNVYPRWCRLFGNLLFYLKDRDPLSSPVGVIVLENCRAIIRSDEREYDGFVFILEFEGSLQQRISTNTVAERLAWVKAIQLGANGYLNRQIKYLEAQIAAAKTVNRVVHETPVGHEVSLVRSGAEVMAAAAPALPKVEEGDLIQF